MVEELTPKENIEVLLLAKQCNLDITNINYLVKYVHPDYFFDYIIRIGDQYYNFCKVSDFNKPRYDNLLAINEHLKDSKYFVSSDARYITHKEQLWFYEHAPSFAEHYDLNVNDLYMIIKSLDLLNDEVESVKVDDSGLPFFETVYKTELERCYNTSDLDYNTMVFADIEKTIELRRMKKTDNGFCFSGLQSFIAYPRLQGIMSILMLSPIFFNALKEFKNTTQDTPSYFPELNIKELKNIWLKI